MSRAKNGFRPPKPKQHPPVQQQLDMLMRGISRLADHLGELELAIEFTMRHVQMGRVKPGGLIDPATGKMPMERASLAQMFEVQRDMFVEMLIKERDAIARATNTETGHVTRATQGNGQAGASAPADADADASAPTLDRATGLYILGGES